MKASADRAAVAPEQLQREARAWLRHLTAGRVTELDARAFRRWRAASSSHQAAFQDAQRWWQTLDPVLAKLVRENSGLAVKPPASSPSSWGRRTFLGGAATLAAAAGVAMIYPPFDLWPSAGMQRADYSTGTGEQRQLALTDHVSVALNTLTSINRQQAGGQTVGIELVSGEAAVDLLAPARRFSVTAGVGRSIATDGHFEVRHLDGITRVTCVDGALRLMHPLGVRTLAARQQTTYDSHSLGAVAAADPLALSAWRDGILVFRQTSLTNVIAEINRYRPGRVVLLDQNVAKRQVSGRFAIHTLDTVLLQIQHTYQLHASTLPGGLLVLT